MLFLTPLFALALGALPTAAQEATVTDAQATPPVSWGQFRGPNGSGMAAGGGLPDVLDSQSSILWEAEIPSGYSSPVVAAGRVFLTGADKTHLMTLCLDEETGEQLWRRKVAYDGKRPGGNSSAAPTPTTDGTRVYALFHHVGLITYDLFGEEAWRNDLGAPFNLPHGLATSPVVHDGKVLIQLDQDDGSALICLDAATGEESWRTERDGAAHSYSTPAIHTPADGPSIAVVSGSYEIAGYSLESGERLWWMTGSAWQSKAVPLIHEDLCIVSAYMPLSGEFGLPRVPAEFADALAEHDADDSGTISRSEWDHEMMQNTWFIWDRNGDDVLDEVDYAYLLTTQVAKGAMYAIRLGGKGDITDTHVAWTYEKRRGLSDVVSPVLVDGRVFLLKDGGLLTAIDAKTGESVQDGRVGEPDQYFASPVAAGGRLLLTGMSGQLTVIEASGEWDAVTTASLEAGKLWSTPALSDGRILVRGQKRLICLGRP